MAKYGKTWTSAGLKWRYYYPNAPSKKGRYKQVQLSSGRWKRGEY